MTTAATAIASVIARPVNVRHANGNATVTVIAKPGNGIGIATNAHATKTGAANWSARPAIGTAIASAAAGTRLNAPPSAARLQAAVIRW